jgi:chromosome segregation and condensation protein ScpB
MPDQKIRAEISATGMIEAVLFAAGNPMTANEIRAYRPAGSDWYTESAA